MNPDDDSLYPFICVDDYGELQGKHCVLISYGVDGLNQ